MDKVNRPDGLNNLFNAVKASIEDCNYRYYGEGDRHGSYELTLFKKHKDGGDNLDRFVVLAVTPEPLPPHYRIEVWYGADDNSSFAHALFATFEMVELNDLKEGPLVTSVKAALQGAALRADTMTQDELTHRRIPQASRKE